MVRIWKNIPSLEHSTEHCSMITLAELQRSTAQVGKSVHRTTISHALHKAGLSGRVARREPLLKQSHAVCDKPCGGYNKHVEEGALVRWDQNWCFWPKCKMLCVAENEHCTSPRTHRSHHETWWWQHHAIGMLFFSRDREAGLSWWEDGWSQIQDNLGRKPVRVCKRLETGAEFHLPAGQRA